MHLIAIVSVPERENVYIGVMVTSKIVIVFCFMMQGIFVFIDLYLKLLNSYCYEYFESFPYKK